MGEIGMDVLAKKYKSYVFESKASSPPRKLLQFPSFACIRGLFILKDEFCRVFTTHTTYRTRQTKCQHLRAHDGLSYRRVYNAQGFAVQEDVRIIVFKGPFAKFVTREPGGVCVLRGVTVTQK